MKVPIKSISELAKLNLSEPELKRFSKDFDEILTAFRVLDRINVDGVRPSFRPVEQRNPLREDKVEKSLRQEEALLFTDHKENGFFIGPKTVE
ncbi:MAG: Asp-tRNA(Asn)/Glu-tRNA(Gln) amidotransferase subunit GatC [archaeon]